VPDWSKNSSELHAETRADAFEFKGCRNGLAQKLTMRFRCGVSQGLDCYTPADEITSLPPLPASPSMLRWALVALGATFGMRFGIFGSLIGAVLGAAAATLLGKRQITDHQFRDSLFSMMGYIAKLDGYVSTREVALAEQLFDQFELEGSARTQAVELFNRGRSGEFDANATLTTFVAKFGMRSDPAINLLSTLITMAFADGKLDNIEHEELKRMSVQLGFREDEFRRELERFGAIPAAQNSLSREAAFVVLGLSPNATAAEIKSAYRKLISQYHPDKLEGAGVRGDALKGAQLKAKEVRAAYEYLCEILRIS
jgi:DnaJ like chaperone protein